MTSTVLKTLVGAVVTLILTSQLASATVACKNTRTGGVKVRDKECEAGEQVVVQEADDAMVASCTFLTSLHASSGWGNAAAEKGMNNAKKSLFAQAAKKNATHILITSTVGGYTSSATAKAYKCAPAPEGDKRKF